MVLLTLIVNNNSLLQDEIDACLEKMAEENKVMRSDDTVYII